MTPETPLQDPQSPEAGASHRDEDAIPTQSILLYRLAQGIGYPTTKIYFRLGVRGLRNVPRTGPLLVISNHGSTLDPPLLGFTCPRPFTYLAKAELFEHWLLGPLIRGLGAFPIKRGSSDRAAIRASVALLRAGKALVMFPEGTRSQDGKPREAQPGVAMLLQQVPEATILPARVDGSFDAWPPGRKLPHPRKITLTYGKPFRISDIGPLPSVKKQLYHEIGKEMMQRIFSAEA